MNCRTLDHQMFFEISYRILKNQSGARPWISIRKNYMKTMFSLFGCPWMRNCSGIAFSKPSRGTSKPPLVEPWGSPGLSRAPQGPILDFHKGNLYENNVFTFGWHSAIDPLGIDVWGPSRAPQNHIPESPGGSRAPPWISIGGG